MNAQLHVVDPETGELVAPGCRQCHEHTTKIAGLEADYLTLTKKYAAAIRSLEAKKRDRETERQQHPRRREVEEIFADWQEIAGKGTSKLGTRQDKIAPRLNEGYTREHFRLAALGAVHNNPWSKRGRKPMVEIGTYASKNEWLEQFANAGAEWEARTRHAPAIRVECGQ